MTKTIIGAAAALALFASSAGHAQQGGILGVLTCYKDAKTEGVTYLFHSRHAVTCTYEGAGASRKYEGTSGILLGVDLDYQIEDGMAYIVIGFGPPSNTLVGSYVGAKATVRIVGGVSAQAGLGGAGNGVFLVPLGIGGGVGLGGAAGIGYLNLTKSK